MDYTVTFLVLQAVKISNARKVMVNAHMDVLITLKEGIVTNAFRANMDSHATVNVQTIVTRMDV
jgi:hypothetical protein